MFGRRFPLFKLMGFQVHVDLSWLILAFLITWTLAVGYFPQHVRGLAPAVYWWMGVAGALGLFASIVFHEFSHSIVARHYGIPMKGITLFIFGGVAEMTREPPNPKSEFLMAIAGPIASVVVGIAFLALAKLAVMLGGGLPIVAVLAYLGWINFLLAIFNMVPAFPLDGGRVLRSILWGARKNLHWATRISSAVGNGFGWLLAALGVFSFFTGNIIGGIWWFVLGIFIRHASQMAFQQMLVREMLQGEPVRQFMRTDPVTVPASATVRDLVEHYIYRSHHKLYPVVDDGALVGCVTLKQVKDVPRSDWEIRRVGDLAQRCNAQNTVTPETDAIRAFSLMNKTGASRLLVTENGRLRGIVSLKDLLKFLALKMELEGEEGATVRRQDQFVGTR